MYEHQVPEPHRFPKGRSLHLPSHGWILLLHRIRSGVRPHRDPPVQNACWVGGCEALRGMEEAC